MRRAWEAWDRFLFRPDTARVLGLYRIVFGLIVIYSFALLAKDVTMFFSDEGLLSGAASAQSLELIDVTVFRWIRAPWAVRATLAALFVSAACFTIGFKTRWSTVALFVLVTSFHRRDIYVLQGGDSAIRTLLFLFMFAPAGAAFSVDRLRRRLAAPGVEPEEVRVAPWAQRMMQMQVAFIYLMAAYGKLLGDQYWDGSAMYYMLGRLDIHVPGLERLMNYPVVYSLMSVAAVAMEIPLPFLLWFRATRPAAALLGVALHAWIVAFMVIPVFGIVMMTTYLAFYGEAEFDRAIERMRRRAAGRRAKMILDARSPWRRVIPILDVLQRVEIEEAPRPAGPGGEASGPRLVTADGTSRAGLPVFLWLLPRLLAVFWVIPALYLPGRLSTVEAPSSTG